MLNGTFVTHSSDVVKTKRYFVCMKVPYLIDASSPNTHKLEYKKGDKTKFIYLL